VGDIYIYIYVYIHSVAISRAQGFKGSRAQELKARTAYVDWNNMDLDDSKDEARPGRPGTVQLGPARPARLGSARSGSVRPGHRPGSDWSGRLGSARPGSARPARPGSARLSPEEEQNCRSSLPPWRTPASPTVISSSSSLPPVMLVAGEEGSLLHVLAFALKARNVTRMHLCDNVYIIGITGRSSCLGVLPSRVTLHTSEDRVITFRDRRPCNCGKYFMFSADRGEQIVDATYKGGTCTGVACALLPVFSAKEDDRSEEKGSDGTVGRSGKQKGGGPKARRRWAAGVLKPVVARCQ